VTKATSTADKHKRAVALMVLWLAGAQLSTARAESPDTADTVHDMKERRQTASAHAEQAREHAGEAMRLHRDDVRAKVKELRESAREHGAIVRDELKQVGSVAREQFRELGQQLKAAGLEAREHTKEARESLHEGLEAGKAELKGAGEKLSQEFAVLRQRAEEARLRVWGKWKAKLRSPEAIDARMQHELDKHARREAKLRRIESVARESHDDAALDRVARLRAKESDRHEARMQKLTDDRAASDAESGRVRL
jgi:hypothetical protein